MLITVLGFTACSSDNEDLKEPLTDQTDDTGGNNTGGDNTRLNNNPLKLKVADLQNAPCRLNLSWIRPEGTDGTYVMFLNDVLERRFNNFLDSNIGYTVNGEDLKLGEKNTFEVFAGIEGDINNPIKQKIEFDYHPLNLKFSKKKWDKYL